MRLLMYVILPLLVQVVAFLIIYLLSRKSAQTIAQLTLPLALVAAIPLVVHGWRATKQGGDMLPPTLRAWQWAVWPPLGLLVALMVVG